MLPKPELSNLAEIENHMRAANTTQPGREALAKFVLNDRYIPKLIPLVEMAEDLESVSDLHRLCSIMKMLILLNDSAIIEFVVTDDVVLGVVGALECRRTSSYGEAPANSKQMTRIFLFTRPTTGSICQTHQSSKRSSRSTTLSSSRRFTPPIDYNTLRTSHWLVSSTILHFQSSIPSYFITRWILSSICKRTARF